MIVIDASVAIKWFVDEPDRLKAEAILNQVKVNPAQFAVPDLFFVEMMSVLTRLVSSKSEIESIISDLFDLGLTQIRVGGVLLRRAASLSFDYKISGYDGLYAASAETVSGVWLTADVKAHGRLQSLGLSRVL